MDFVKLQKELDNLEYPPTLQYTLDPLKPQGVLAERMEIIKSVAPLFFEGGEYCLDVGCNKGYFSLLMSQYAKEVVSLDTDEKFVNFCSKIKPSNMQVQKLGFRDFVPKYEFDRIFIGNVHHYLFKEANGWDWIYKLAALSCDKVLIEGPIDMKCRDMRHVIPLLLQKEFTFERFMEIMNKFFMLKVKIPTVAYTPNRYIMYFERKTDLFQTQRIGRKQIPKGKLLKEDKNSRISIIKIPQFDKPVVAKIIKNPLSNQKMAVAISRFSPVSNGAIGSIYQGTKFVGWIEAYTKGGVYHYRENERALFLKICDHEIFLSRLGYFDTDCTTINFFRKNDKIFDKGSVMPISDISKEVYETFNGRPQGYFFIHLNRSFSCISPLLQKKIYKALECKNSKEIENIFLQIKDILKDIPLPSQNKLFLLRRVLLLKLVGWLNRVLPLFSIFLTKFEDFCPLSKDEALITMGIDYSYLKCIKCVKYKTEENRVKINFLSAKTIIYGSYLRLGNVFNNKLVYSDEQQIFEKNIQGGQRLIRRGLQPYCFKEGLLYQYDGSIYLNENEIIRPWGDFRIVGRPSFDDGWIYFETRNGPAPDSWQVWRYNLKSKEKQQILKKGANPYVYSDKLFYSKWEKNRFNSCWIKKPSSNID